VVQTSRPSAQDASDRILANRYILVVDDDSDARDIFTAVIAYHGGLVHTASSARHALRLLSYMRPDVMISDIAMPNQSGLWLVRRLRQRGDTVPIIGVTGYDTPAEAMRDAGFDVAFTKPVDHGLLIQTLHRLATTPARARDRRVLPFRPGARRDPRHPR
jgi:CheY-like chemotaxis protein